MIEDFIEFDSYYSPPAVREFIGRLDLLKVLHERLNQLTAAGCIKEKYE